MFDFKCIENGYFECSDDESDMFEVCHTVNFNEYGFTFLTSYRVEKIASIGVAVVSLVTDWEYPGRGRAYNEKVYYDRYSSRD
jgi:hypothetical protein